MFEKFEKFNVKLSRAFEWVSIGAMLLIVAVTFMDVAGAKFFRLPLPGSIDIVMLAQLVAIAFAAGMALIKGRHIQVEFFVRLLPRNLQKVIDIFVLLLTLLLFSAIIWRLGVLGYSFQTSGEYSATIRIPYYPFAYGLALACVPVWLITLVQLLKALTMGVQK